MITMTKMMQTNYWNPSVNYIVKNAAQDYMISEKARLISNAAKATAGDCSCNCSSGYSACSSTCGSCSSCST